MKQYDLDARLSWGNTRQEVSNIYALKDKA